MPDQPKEVTASVEPAPPDQRPEPPAEFPTMYILTWWEWKYDEWYKKWEWRTNCSMFPMDRVRANEESAKLVAIGCHLVRIITIPGEPRHA